MRLERTILGPAAYGPWPSRLNRPLNSLRPRSTATRGVHHLPLSHLSPGHCIIVVMLFISIICESQERYEGIGDDLLLQVGD